MSWFERIWNIVWGTVESSSQEDKTVVWGN
jgi:hypothetical protein